jgi:hypothetical protein
MRLLAFRAEAAFPTYFTWQDNATNARAGRSARATQHVHDREVR